MILWKRTRSKKKQLQFNFKKKKGFTLVEILVSITIFVIVSTLAVSAFLNILSAYRRLNISRQILEGGRFMMERLVKEMRNNTIDYGYYYLDHPDNAGQSYYDYLAIPPSSTSPEHQIIPQMVEVLALVSPSGKKRTIIGSGRMVNDSATGLNLLDTARNNPQLEDYRVFLKQMEYNAANNTASNPAAVPPDPLVPILAFPGLDPYDEDSEFQVNWEWYNDAQFNVDTGLSEEQRVELGWKPFSSNDISIRSLHFIISPAQDPYKFWDTSSGSEILNYQSQPMITIRMKIEPALRNRAGMQRVPTLDLQTTVSSRLYNQIYYYGWPKLN